MGSERLIIRLLFIFDQWTDIETMDALILQHQIGQELQIITVYSDYAKAKDGFTTYLNLLEEVWREGEDACPENTFNRFSEPTQDFVLNATCGDHSVFVQKFPVE